VRRQERPPAGAAVPEKRVLMRRDGLLETYKSSFKLLEPDALRHMVL